MAAATRGKLSWCLVRLGDDLNWWVHEVSDPIAWDPDGLGIIDPRQLGYILEQCEVLQEYGFDADVVESAFLAFRAEKEEKDGIVRLSRTTTDLLLEDSATLFALPDLLDEEKGPYADLLEAITRSRVKLLNDLIDFEQNLTIDELEEAVRDRQNQDYMEGRAVHPFMELTSILEFVPDGYQLEDDGDGEGNDEDGDLDDIPDFDEPEEKIEEDETMKWDEDEEEDDGFDDDLGEKEEDEER